MVSIREASIEMNMKLKDVDYPWRGVAPDSYGCMFVFAMYSQVNILAIDEAV